MMNSARISAVVALTLLTGVAIWGGTLHFLENGTNIAGESLSPADRNEQVLLDGLADGRILYFKIEDYRMDRIIPGASDPPHRVIIENWWQPDTGDQGELNVVTVRDQDGRLLQYTQAIDGKYTTTYVSSGETMEMNVRWGSPAEWIDWIWNSPQNLASNPDFELKGIGELNGRATLIYEGWSDSRKTRWEREFVEDAPLLLRRSTYRIDSDSREDLTEEETVVEYRLLPPGSSIPQLPYPQSTDRGRVVPGWLSKRSCASGFNGTRVGSPNIHYGKPFPSQGAAGYNCTLRHCWGGDMADTHFHVWHYQRDPDGVIRSMERRPERYEKRRAANRALEMFRRKHCIAGQVLQCVDGAFCEPPPDWVVQGYTLGGAVEVGTEYFIDQTPSIRPSRKMELGMENLADYVQENPDLVVRRPRAVQ